MLTVLGEIDSGVLEDWVVLVAVSPTGPLEVEAVVDVVVAVDDNEKDMRLFLVLVAPKSSESLVVTRSDLSLVPGVASCNTLDKPAPVPATVVPVVVVVLAVVVLTRS